MYLWFDCNRNGDIGDFDNSTVTLTFQLKIALHFFFFVCPNKWPLLTFENEVDISLYPENIQKVNH